MMERSSMGATLILASLLARAEPVCCRAQQLAATSPAASHAATGAAGEAGKSSSPLPPSTVSPAIERFVQTHRQVLPRPAEPPPLSPSTTGSRRPASPAGSTSSRTVPIRLRVEQQPVGIPPALPPPEDAQDLGRSLRTPQGLRHVTELRFRPAPFESSDLRFPMNLASVLQLADARPLIVAAAQASVWVAEAELTRAKVIWVPTVFFGFDYIRHDGGGPDFNKGIMVEMSVNYFMGGAGANLYFNLTDAYFQPQVARQLLNAAHWDVQKAKNDALQQAADAYFRVHQYRGMYAGALYAVERGKELVEIVADLSKEFVPKVEVDRARNMLADLEQRSVLARQEWRVASADLTQLLRLDPRAVVDPMEHDHAQVTMIDPGLRLEDLMPVALHNRPELAFRQARVQAAEIGIEREKWRPVIPIVMLNGFQHASMYLQAGIFSLGPNSSLNQWVGRQDVSLQLVWQLDAFGIGNMARIKGARGDESRAIVEWRKAQDMVAADVTRALARVQSGAARVLQADRALRTALITFNGHLEGLGQTRRLENVLVLTFRPQEAVYSLEQLNVSFNEYFSTVAEYNRAQFDLFHALGYPARELAQLRKPGEAMPVDLTRPAFLPPVGNGPPPATR
jgi:outer membrane protein TolC